MHLHIVNTVEKDSHTLGGSNELQYNENTVSKQAEL